MGEAEVRTMQCAHSRHGGQVDGGSIGVPLTGPRPLLPPLARWWTTAPPRGGLACGPAYAQSDHAGLTDQLVVRMRSGLARAREQRVRLRMRPPAASASSPRVPRTPSRPAALTLSLFSGSTSIIPLRRLWQSGGMKWGMWKTPRFTFSSSWRRLSSSKGSAPCAGKGTPHTRPARGPPATGCPKNKPRKPHFWFSFIQSTNGQFP